MSCPAYSLSCCCRCVDRVMCGNTVRKSTEGDNRWARFSVCEMRMHPFAQHNSFLHLHETSESEMRFVYEQIRMVPTKEEEEEKDGLPLAIVAFHFDLLYPSLRISPSPPRKPSTSRTEVHVDPSRIAPAETQELCADPTPPLEFPMNS
mmetsp:Transcript_21041/g.58531  ORF Transcript_21041/g.58531 Transcript_21041/m.58531 type:complete len:149 (+) Transcript_21041:438-884(+)